MPNKITKANGHIVQSDWGQTDPMKMDYIHNKPELDNYGKIRNDEVTYQRIPVIAGASDLTDKNPNEVSLWLTPDFALDLVSSLGANNVIPTYTNRTETRNIKDTSGESRHLWTSTPTADYMCANKKYVDRKIADMHAEKLEPHKKVFAVKTDDPESVPQYTVCSGLVSDTWNNQGFINFTVETLVIYTSSNSTYTPMVGPYTLAIERVHRDYFEGIGCPIEWSIFTSNATLVSGDGYVTEAEYNMAINVREIKVKLNIRTTAVDEAYIQLTQYSETDAYFPS